MRREKYKAEDMPKYSTAILVSLTFPAKSKEADTRRKRIDIAKFVKETDGCFVKGSKIKGKFILIIKPTIIFYSLSIDVL